MDNLKVTSEIAKNTSETIKNFYGIIENILQPRGVDLAIIEGHKKIIEAYTQRSDIDEFSKIAFLSGYKKMVREYKNCTTIIEHAAPMVSEDARPQDVEEDWFSFFFDKVRLVSNEALQNMWSRVLANEVNTPGTFQRSLLHTLSIMSSSQAELFCSLSRFCMREYKGQESIHPLIFISSNARAYERSKIFPLALMELEQLGLIQCDFKNEFVFWDKKVFRYGNKVIEVYGDPDNKEKIKTGNVAFTLDGRALYNIVHEDFKKYRPDILDFMITKFQRRNCKVVINGKLIT